MGGGAGGRSACWRPARARRTGTTTCGWPPGFDDPGDCTVDRPVGVVGEGRAHDRAGPGLQRVRRGASSRRRLPVRPTAEQGVGRGDHPAGDRVGRGASRARGRSSGRRRRAPGARCSTSAWPTTGEPAMAPEAEPFMQTPLVIAMPKPMADALGYPETPVGWEDVLRLAQERGGVGRLRPSRVGSVPPRQDQPELLDQRPVRPHRPGLRGDRQDDRPVVARTSTTRRPRTFATGVESAVVHYGDITGTFLNNWYRTDREGTSLTYASAVAVEEKSVIDYNAGNPDGVLDPGERPRKPRIPLVAVYPKEGTLYSDNPIFVLDAPWVDDAERDGRPPLRGLHQAAREPAQGARVRLPARATPTWRSAAPIVAGQRRRPRPADARCSTCPTPPVMIDLLDKWAEQRKSARVLIVLDVSGSMSEVADQDTGETRLDLAKAAAIEALDQFKDEDEVGLRTFTTNEDGDRRGHPRRRADRADRAQQGGAAPRDRQPGAALRHAALPGDPHVLPGGARQLRPRPHQRGRAAHRRRSRTTANADDDQAQEQAMLEVLRSTQGETGKPVRIFPIAFARGRRHGRAAHDRRGDQLGRRTARPTRRRSARCSPRS